uniref:Uncharacterized protein n=1 Tax=Heterorhabditis bacteriophora TaxID=37862 RepID=A0A1I7XGG1_HETBA
MKALRNRNREPMSITGPIFTIKTMVSKMDEIMEIFFVLTHRELIWVPMLSVSGGCCVSDGMIMDSTNADIKLKALSK